MAEKAKAKSCAAISSKARSLQEKERPRPPWVLASSIRLRPAAQAACSVSSGKRRSHSQRAALGATCSSAKARARATTARSSSVRIASSMQDLQSPESAKADHRNFAILAHRPQLHDWTAHATAG